LTDMISNTESSGLKSTLSNLLSILIENTAIR
jgi:hypothetical protein